MLFEDVAISDLASCEVRRVVAGRSFWGCSFWARNRFVTSPGPSAVRFPTLKRVALNKAAVIQTHAAAPGPVLRQRHAPKQRERGSRRFHPSACRSRGLSSCIKAVKKS